MSKPGERSSREMAARLREEAMQREKAIMQRLMAEEREIFLEENPEDKGNESYEGSRPGARDLRGSQARTLM